MVRRVTGVASKSNHSPILGYSDTSTVKLDFDDVPLKKVKYWARRVCDWFKLGGFIILRSSENHYHVLFDASVDWAGNCHVMGWVAVESRIQKLMDYVLMQLIKESSTVRVGAKGKSGSPKIVYRWGSQSNEIKNFLEYRKKFKKINRKKYLHND
jgi:hypothetical protein